MDALVTALQVDVSTIVNAFFALVALVAGGLSALLWGSLKALRDSNSDLRNRDADRDIKVAEMAAEITTLKNDRDALARQIRGDDKIDALLGKLDAHHAESMTHWAAGEALLTGIADELTTGGRPE